MNDAPTIGTQIPPESDSNARPRPNGEHSDVSHVPTHYPARIGRKVAIFAVAAIIGLAAVFVFRYSFNAHADAQSPDLQKAANELVTVDVIHVAQGAAQKSFTLPGEARPFRESTVFARTSGYLASYAVDIGDPVKHGDTLALIETPELNDQIAAAGAKIKQLKAEVKVAETSRAFAKISFDRWSASSGDGAVSVQERDQKKSELDSSDAKLDAANADVALAEADLQRLLTMDKFKTVTAPFDGTITERRIDVGDLISAGSTSNTTALFCIAQSDQMRVFVDVPQSLAPEVVKGMTAVAVCANGHYPGHVDRTAEMINLASRTLKVEVLVDNPTHTLLPGTYLQVTFELRRARPPLQIPSSALVWRANGPNVAVIGDGGRVKFLTIRIMRDMGDLVEIEGLQGGERVALNLGSQAPEGERVETHDVDPPAIPAIPAIPRPAGTAILPSPPVAAAGEKTGSPR